MNYIIEIEKEEDGRWIADIPDLPGVMVYGKTSEEAITKVQALALRVIAEKMEHTDNNMSFITVSFAAA